MFKRASRNGTASSLSEVTPMTSDKSKGSRNVSFSDFPARSIVSVERRLDSFGLSNDSAWAEAPWNGIRFSQQVKKRSEFWCDSYDLLHRPLHRPAGFGSGSCGTSLFSGSSSLSIGSSSDSFHDVLWQELRELGSRLVDVHELELDLTRRGQADAEQAAEQAIHTQSLSQNTPSTLEESLSQGDPVQSPPQSKPCTLEESLSQGSPGQSPIQNKQSTLEASLSRKSTLPLPEAGRQHADVQETQIRIPITQAPVSDASHPPVSPEGKFSAWHSRRPRDTNLSTSSIREASTNSLYFRYKSMGRRTEASAASSNAQGFVRPSAPYLTVKSGLGIFVILDVWDFKAKAINAKAKLANIEDPSNDDADFEEIDEDSDDEEVLPTSSPFIVNPTSGKKFIWDMISCFLVLYEAITTPLTILDPLDHVSFDIFAWAKRVFWSVDLPLNLLTGYVMPEGNVEMRVHKVVWTYVRTWFFLDLFLLITDWMEVVADGFGSGASAARMVKSLKFLRMIRMTRMLRLFRLEQMPDFIKAIAFYMQGECGEVLSICVGMIKIMSFVVLLNHTLACVFYAIGNEVEGGVGWIRHHELESTSQFYKYLTAYHWSLTQFAGTMEVSPTNTAERVYAITVLLFAFVISAFVVSRITSSLTHLEIATAQRTEKLFSLRTYLNDCNISGRLALRVQRNAKFAMRERNRNTPEAEIDLLHIISQPLLVELHCEMHMPILEHHPFFRNFYKVNARVMKRVCHHAIMKLALMDRDVVFNEGELSAHPYMYFLKTGSMAYKRAGFPVQLISCGDWACEASLWTVWAHLGTMRASSDTSIILLDVNKFQEVVLQARDEHVLKYGRAFVKALNGLDEESLSDLDDEAMNLGEIAHTTCPPPGRARPITTRTLLSNRLTTLSSSASLVFKSSQLPSRHGSAESSRIVLPQVMEVTHSGKEESRFSNVTETS